MKKTFKVVLPIMVLISAWFGVAYIKDRPTSVSKQVVIPESRLKVQTQVLSKQNFIPSIRTEGEVKASVSGAVTAEVSGTLIFVSSKLKTAELFSEGEVLARLDPRVFEADIVIAEGNLSSARLKLEEEIALGIQAKADWQRSGRSGEPSDMVLRKPHRLAAEAQLKAAQASLLQSQINLEKATIKAPYAGKASNGYFDEGHYLAAGQVIADIIGTEHYEVHLPLSLAALAHIGLDHQTHPRQLSDVVISLSAKSGLETHFWEASLSKVSPILDAQTRQVILVAQILQNRKDSNSINTMPTLGQFIQATIRGVEMRDVFVAPLTAVYDNDHVFVAEEDRLQRRNVNLLWRDQQQAVLTGDIHSGERLVTTALGKPISGTLLSFE